MLKTASQKVVDSLIQTGIIQEEQRALYAYGLRSMFLQICNFTTACLVGLLLGAMWECIFFVIAFPYLRTYAGGAHVKSPVVCYLLSCGIVAAVLLVYKYFPQPLLVPTNLILMMIAVPVIEKLAPVGSPNKPLDEAEKSHFRRIILRRLALEVCVWAGLMLLGFHRLALLIALSCGILMVLLIIGRCVHQD